MIMLGKGVLIGRRSVMVKGNIMYVPKELIEEFERIKAVNRIDKKSDVFKRIAKNSKIGSDITTALDDGVSVLDKFLRRRRRS